jgi:hypothetical protein
MISVVGLVVCTSAIAQESRSPTADLEAAARQLGVYVTEPVKQDYNRRLAVEFANVASQAGFDQSEIEAISNGLTQGNVKVASGGKSGRIIVGSAVFEKGPKKTSLVLSLLSTNKALASLERYSSIKLTVRPAPPRDYKVIVNGTQCPATDQGLYKVMPGESAINVSRPRKAQCEWHGLIAAGAVREVDCNL